MGAPGGPAIDPHTALLPSGVSYAATSAKPSSEKVPISQSTIPSHSATGNCAASCTDLNATIAARSSRACGMSDLIRARSTSSSTASPFGLRC